MQSEENIDHMTMPSRPGAMLIMIHSDLTFSFLEALFNGPSHNRGFAHLGQRHIDRRIGKGEFDLSIRTDSNEEPDRILLGQSISGRIDTQTGHLRADRSFSAFGQDDRFPVAFVRADDHSDGFGLGLTG